MPPNIKNQSVFEKEDISKDFLAVGNVFSVE